MNSSPVYPFYIYDRRKSHGYIYSPIDRLYHKCDRHNIRKCAGRIVDITEWIDKDLRNIMDFAPDTIPIVPGSILIPSTREIRPRTEHDYFTYEISLISSGRNLSEYLSQLIPKKEDYELLRKFLRMSLIYYDKNNYIIIRGSSEANSNLINILLTLYPLINHCRHTLFCETCVNKITLDEIHQARIVLCDIGDRTIRPSQSFIGRPYERPIQYHGIIFQKQVFQPIPELKSRTINIVQVLHNDLFTAGDLLNWTLS